MSIKPNAFQHIHEKVSKIENGLTDADGRQSVYHKLQVLGLNDFLQTLWYMPDTRYPRLSALLPAMASPDVQMHWTGQSDLPLIVQTASFVRAANENYTQIKGETLKDKRILDFGCGYGRMLRAFSYYSDYVFGVDPWSESIKACNEAGITENVSQSAYLPETLPAPTDFDFVFAFSVFTHLSERAAKTNLAAIRKHMKTGALACITIRPVEYWPHVYRNEAPEWISTKMTAHNSIGFAFHPHNREPVDGDITYGDSSMTVEWLMSTTNGFELAGLDRSGDDEYQRYIYLKAI